MIRIILFLFLVGIVALGAAIVADQTGNVVLTWSAWRIETSLPVLVLLLALLVAAATIIWVTIRGFVKTPERMRRMQQERRLAKGRDAVAKGLIAIGAGDHFAARRHADAAGRLAHQDPLALLLQAQTAQLYGDGKGAQRAFHAMAERKDTRLLGLHGLFVEAQRRDDPYAAVALAEEALKTAPAAAWASQAVLGFRCSQGDWDGALKILENNLAAGLIDPAPYKRQRGVLLAARALDLEASDRDKSRASVMEAVKFAPTLVPAATLAAKFLSENNQTRRAMQVIETAWVAQPHPDLADAYAHVRLGDSALNRLNRVEKLAAKVPGHIEGALAVARAAIDAGEFSRAREMLQPFIDAPTQRVAIMVAELERAEHGDSGSARGWMLRAVRAGLDPAWTADGYISHRWRPVSPVTGRLDAFQWLTPVAALPSDKAPVLDVPVAGDEPALPAPQDVDTDSKQAVPLPPASAELPPAQDNEPAASSDALPSPQPATAPVVADAPPPVFRPRRDIEKPDASRVAPVIPIVRAPDDPGVEDGRLDVEYDDPDKREPVQEGGWKGFFSRLVS